MFFSFISITLPMESLFTLIQSKRLLKCVWGILRFPQRFHDIQSFHVTAFGMKLWCYMHCVITDIVQLHSSLDRELFHGRRWLEDPRFFSPMVDTPSGSVFVSDFVSFRVAAERLLGRVLLFYCKVQNTALNGLYILCL